MTRSTTAIGYRANLPVTDPQAFVTEEVPVPDPGPHDLLVEVEAVSVNPVDVKQRAGSRPHGLRVLGYDAAGTVVAVGESVTLFRVGDPVFYAGAIDRPGSNQRLHLVDERIVGRKPASLSFGDAASLPLTAITAWESLFDRLALTPDAAGTMLVVGATGGVGSVLIQLAKALLLGVRIIATASDPEREAWVRELGAHHTVDHRQGWEKQVTAIAPDGVQWIFTAHSKDQIPAYAQVIAPFGHIVAIDDGPRDVAPLKGKSASWHWELMFTRSRLQTADMVEQHRLLDRVAGLVDEGRLRATTSTTLSPISAENLREAHRLVETGRTIGKVVVAGWE